MKQKKIHAYKNKNIVQSYSFFAMGVYIHSNYLSANNLNEYYISMPEEVSKWIYYVIIPWTTSFNTCSSW